MPSVQIYKVRLTLLDISLLPFFWSFLVWPNVGDQSIFVELKFCEAVILFAALPRMSHLK